MFRPSPRSWLLLSVPVLALVVLVAWQAYRPGASEQRTHARLDLPAEPLADTPLRGGPTALLSRCGVDDWPRPKAHGKGERGRTPQLEFGGWGSSDTKYGKRGKTRFTVHLALRVKRLPMLLAAPRGARNITLDVFGPHGEGRRASARGLSATVVDAEDGKPVRPRAPGPLRVAPGTTEYLDVELPAGAVCPGYSVGDVADCEPLLTNDSSNCPVVTLTLTDPAVRSHRARTTGKPPAGLSDRLVVVSEEPEVSTA